MFVRHLIKGSLVLFLAMGLSAEGKNSFDYNLYSQIQVNKNPKNIVFSPLSISTSLSMVSLGAKGTTKEEIKKVLQNNNKSGDISPVKRDGLELSIANSIFVQKGLTLVPEFDQELQKNFQVTSERVNFQNREKAVYKINSWVREATRHKITNIVSLNDINPVLTKLVLTNAVYLKAEWQKPFNPMLTSPGIFFPAPKQNILVEKMQQTDLFNYAENSTLQALELPYKESNLSMIIVLPKERFGINKIEDMLRKDQSDQLEKLIGNLARHKVSVLLPKFKVETSYGLNEELSLMGMATAFDRDKADFSGITQDEDLSISKVLHETFLKVTETGTEASAATAVVMNARCIHYTKFPPEIAFDIDHPFLFIIRDKETNKNVFMGKITTPTVFIEEETRNPSELVKIETPERTRLGKQKEKKS